MKNFSLSLYAFHLRQTLDDPPDSCNCEADRLWESLVQFGQILKFPELKKLKSQLISYTPKDDNYQFWESLLQCGQILNFPEPKNPKSQLISYTPKDDNYQYTPQREETRQHEWITHHADAVEFTPIPTLASFKLTGNLQAFRLHDTYCADLTLYPEDEDSEIAIEHLQLFKPHHLVKKIDANLGKFFWLTGYTNSRKLKEIADRWANAFCTNIGLVPQFIEQGKLFQADSFLYETKDITILISFTHPNKSENIQQSATDNYTWFRDLLWSRQKIIFADREAKECYQKSRTIYSQLETKIQSFQTILQKESDRIIELDTLLKKIPQDLLTYKCYLRDLKAHYTTLETNTKNFNTCLIHVIQSSDSLTTWTDFVEKICPRYLTQIETYINYLEPGKDLFTDLTNNIRTTVEIEQAKSDRILQDNVQAIGVGIAVGAIIASSSGLMTQPITWPWNKERGQYIHPFLIAVLGSLVVAIAAWKCTKWILQKWRSHNKSDS